MLSYYERKYYKGLLINIAEELETRNVKVCEKLIFQTVFLSLEEMVVALDKDRFDEVALNKSLSRLEDVFKELNLGKEFKDILEPIIGVLSKLISEIKTSYNNSESTISKETGYELMDKLAGIRNTVNYSCGLSEEFVYALNLILDIYNNILGIIGDF